MLKSLCSRCSQKLFVTTSVRVGSELQSTRQIFNRSYNVSDFKWQKSLGNSFLQQSRPFPSPSLQTKSVSLSFYNIQRCFRTSSSKNALPPFLLADVLGRLAKAGAVLVGGFARLWWFKLPQERKTELAGRLSRHRNILLGVLGGIGFGAYVYYDTHIQEAPITKRKRFVAFKEDQFNEIAKHQLQQLFEEHKNEIIPASLDQPVYQRVVKVAQRLLNSNLDLDQIHNKEWAITVVKDDGTLNAFVHPCGSIFVFSGLLKLCETDDQLAVLLGHEMAHAVLGHGSEKASFVHLMDLLYIIPWAALWALIPSVFAGLFLWFLDNMSVLLVSLPYIRSLETEADEVGLILAAKACFDVREAPVVWAKMAALKQMVGHPEIEWLSTHPSSENRQVQLEEFLPQAIQTRETCKCPKLPFLDPRVQIAMIKKLSANANIVQRPRD